MYFRHVPIAPVLCTSSDISSGSGKCQMWLGGRTRAICYPKVTISTPLQGHDDYASVQNVCVESIFDGGIKLVKPAPVMDAMARLGFPDSLAVGIGLLALACRVVYAIP